MKSAKNEGYEAAIYPFLYDRKNKFGLISKKTKFYLWVYSRTLKFSFVMRDMDLLNLKQINMVLEIIIQFGIKKNLIILLL